MPVVSHAAGRGRWLPGAHHIAGDGERCAGRVSGTRCERGAGRPGAGPGHRPRGLCARAARRTGGRRDARRPLCAAFRRRSPVEGSLRARVLIRRMEERDLDSVEAIETAARPWAAHWTREAYFAPADMAMCAWVAERAGKIAGFVLARYAGGEMEILNLAVAQAARRKGTGRALVRA